MQVNQMRKEPSRTQRAGVLSLLSISSALHYPATTKHFSSRPRPQRNARDSGPAQENRSRRPPPGDEGCDEAAGLASNCCRPACARRAQANPFHGQNRLSDDRRRGQPRKPPMNPGIQNHLQRTASLRPNTPADNGKSRILRS